MEAIKILNRTIEIGEKTVVKLPVGQLPSGNKISIQSHIFRSNQPGPTVLILAGVHGDEINGVELVRRTLAGNLYDDLLCGTVIAIPLLNVYGFINFSRDLPDGKDVNRSFPGNTKGSLAARVARVLTRSILPLIDFGVDFHTGGNNHYNYPQIRFTKGDKKSEELAQIFGAPYLLEKPPIKKSLRKVGLDAGKPIIVFEGGQNLKVDGYSIEEGINGIKRVLAHYKMLDEAPQASQNIQVLRRSSWIRAPKAGIFQWSKASGNSVGRGEPIGVIYDPYGQEEHPILASRTGHIVGHNNTPVVNPGDALFHIAE